MPRLIVTSEFVQQLISTGVNIYCVVVSAEDIN